MSEAATETTPAAPAGQQTAPATQTDQATQPAPAAPAAATKAPDASQPPAPAPPADETVEAKAARLEAENTRLRRENGKDRVSAKEKAANEAVTKAVKDMAVALGIVQASDEAPDPAVLTQQIKAEQDKSKLAEVKLAVFQNAGDADPNRLLRDVPFLEAIKDIASDDTAAIKAAITKATTDSPWLKTSTAPAAGKGGTEMAGGTGEGAITQEQFDRMPYDKRAELYQQDPNRYRQLAAGSKIKE